MSENRTTLFRFRTNRPPELLSQATKDAFFINHPDGTSGPFYAGVAGKAANETIRQAMETAAANFTSSSKATLVAINNPLFEFSQYLLKKRKDLVYADIDPWVNPTSIATLTAAQRLTLWDNLFYQCIEQTEADAREAILHMLIADRLIERYADTNIIPVDDDELVRAYANARVMLPSSLFKVENQYRTASTEADIGPNRELLEPHLDVLENSLLAQWAEKALNELSAKHDQYIADEMIDEATALDTYNTDCETAQGNTPTEDVVDQYSGKTFNVYSQPVDYPDYDYTPDDEIPETGIEGLSDESKHLLESNELMDGDTFHKIQTNAGNFITERLDDAFQKTEFGLESIDVNGTAVPTCSIQSQRSRKYPYLVKALKKKNGHYAIILSVKVGNACIRLRDVTFDKDNPVDQTFTRFKASNVNGVVTIHVTLGSSAEIDDLATEIPVSGELKFDNGLVLSFADDLEMDEYGTAGYMISDDAMTGNEDLFVPSGHGLAQLGIEEYRKVEQYLCGYEPGEVSHIENIMAREYKERSTRRLRTSEDTTVSTAETESENLTDTTSTTRFDMQKEVSKVLSENRELGVNAEVYASASGEIPTVGSFTAGFSAGGNFALNKSKEESSNIASNFAQDITQKALERVVSKVSEQRTERIVEEFEENNRHGFDNRKGSKHVSGVYRWVDKIYMNEIQNFGKRLQYEFMIPEPASFHLLTKQRGVSNSAQPTIVKPLDPRNGSFGAIGNLKSAAAVTEANYRQWAGMYNAEVSAPPERILTIGKSINKVDSNSATWYLPYSVAGDMPIPDGYGLKRAWVASQTALKNKTDKFARVTFGVGDSIKSYNRPWIGRHLFFEDKTNRKELDKYTESIPYSIEFHYMMGGTAMFSFELERKPGLFQQWQLETFNAIIDAYEEQLQNYRDQLAELEAKRANMGTNPAYFREIEQTVLKKNCVAYLMGHTNMGKNFVRGEKAKDIHVNISKKMDEYAATVKFFEQAFEWGIMSYKFYPFFWGHKEEWTGTYDLESNDATFKAFLQAGMARVVVTVRPGFEEAVMLYMSTGQIWNGGEVPTLEDDLYLSIVEELKEPEYTIEEKWTSRVPSTLTLVQKDTVALNASGLPNWCDTNPPEAPDDTINEDTTTLGTLDVFIEGDTSS